MAEPSVPAAIGFRVKSGFAIGVLLTGSAGAPRVIDRRKVDLSDPNLPASRQPYHAAFGTAQTDDAVVERLVETIERCARQSMSALIGEYRSRGYDLSGAGLVVGSDINPDLIANPHIRAHASEGRIFRRVTEDAVRQAGLMCAIWVERDFVRRAADRLNRSEAEVKAVITNAGRGLRGGWRADDKTAALAAWLALAGEAGT